MKAWMSLSWVVAVALALAAGCSDASDPSLEPQSEALAARCVQNVLCIKGDHWDPVACRCVPNADAGQCVSNAGGPCGGFTTHPCTCAPGTQCVFGPIADVPGVCAVCDPIPCPKGEHWDATKCACEAGCRTALDCHGALPQLCRICPDGLDGCAHFECVAGTCEIAYCE